MGSTSNTANLPTLRKRCKNRLTFGPPTENRLALLDTQELTQMEFHHKKKDVGGGCRLAHADFPPHFFDLTPCLNRLHGSDHLLFGVTALFHLHCTILLDDEELSGVKCLSLRGACHVL
jgi:hypothetical protein